MSAFLVSQSLPVQIVIGLVAIAVLVLSAEKAVDKIVGIAEYLNLSATFMGMTVLSLATSIPEISSHYTASVGILTGSLDYRVASSIVLGANIGSDVVQQTLIMGLVVFMSGTLYFRRYFLWKSMIPMIGTTIMCIILGWDRHYSHLDGLILFGTFILYTYYLYYDERKYYKKVESETPHISHVPKNPREAIIAGVIALAAMALTVLSAQVVLVLTEQVVAATGIGGSFIGVVTLGVASALPELTTALSGVRHNAKGVSIGTLVGSNITNPLVAIGGGALISTYWVPKGLIYWDLPWETVTGAILWVILWFNKGRLGRLASAYLVGLYVLFVVLRGILFLAD